MGYVGKLGNLFSSLNNFYNEINPATLSGAIDIVVIQQANGDLACSPFHVRFGKLSVLRPQEKKVPVFNRGKKTKRTKVAFIGLNHSFWGRQDVVNYWELSLKKRARESTTEINITITNTIYTLSLFFWLG
jgi:hypothetical protein